MDEISKIGDINSVNDLFDFKISIKTIILLVFLWGFACLVIIVVLFGGVNNTVDYALAFIETVKTILSKKSDDGTQGKQGKASPPSETEPKEKKETTD